tara:strand:+ start:2776 stop:3210 length:435 start_codon:yes stop_codon:yes gene_type:complete
MIGRINEINDAGRTQAFLPLFVASLLLSLSIFVFAEETGIPVLHFSDSTTERLPALTKFPEYPVIARRDRIEGAATVCFKIGVDGRIIRPRVTDYSHKIFRKPALRAIKLSTFEPVGPDQILKKAKTCRTYRFRLEPLLANNVG